MKRTGTTRHTLHSGDALDDAIDVKRLIAALVKKGKLEDVEALFSGLQRTRKGSFRKACATLGPLAVSVLAQASVKADRWADRINASRDLLVFGGHKPAEKQELSGPDGGPIETKTDLSGLSTSDLKSLRILLTKAKQGTDANSRP